jgi:apolipoprotein N-acyltransferase
MTGLTVLLVLWAGLPSVFLERSSRPARTVAVIVLIALPAAWAAGTWRLSSATDGVVPGVSIRIVQPNIGQEQKWREDNARAIFDLLKNLSMAPTPQRPDGIGGVTHVIWPESAVPFLIDESAGAKAELRPMLGGRTVLITGALRRAPGDGPDRNVYNSIITFNGEAEVAARYDKWRLVPGGEFLPFESVLEPLGFRKVVTVPGSFAAGPGAVTVAVPGLPGAALLVCYEAIFPHGLIDPRHRPGVLVNVTNDGWFGRSTGPYQHLAQARLRAIEQGLPLLRAANTGISVVIDSYGRELSRLPLMQQGVIDAALPVALASTYYATFGDAAMLVLVLLSAALSLTLRKAMPSDASGQLRSS